MNRLLALIIALGLVCATGLVTVAAITTHESHMNELRQRNEQMLKCIDSDRSAAECRVIVYGSY